MARRRAVDPTTIIPGTTKKTRGRKRGGTGLDVLNVGTASTLDPMHPRTSMYAIVGAWAEDHNLNFEQSCKQLGIKFV
jgi:hypothetical protein